METELPETGIQIHVMPEFDTERSNIEASIYVYRYTVTIKNNRSDTVQLMTRHWIIEDGFNRVEEVKGTGVVGQTPILAPGDEFVYTSLCPLNTPTGNMRGYFHFIDENSKPFKTEIARFFLKTKDLVN